MSDAEQPTVSEQNSYLAQRSQDYVDNASSSVGRAMRKAAVGLSERAESARGNLDRAGHYLERSRPDELGRDLTQWLRDNPGPAIGIGLGLGFMFGRLLSRRADD